MLLLFIVAIAISSGTWYLAMRGVTRLTRNAPRRSSEEVSILVAVHNEEAHLPDLLECLRAQTYPHRGMHLVFGLDRCTDRSRELVDAFDPDGMTKTIVAIDAVPDGISPKKYILNEMIAAATTDALLFTDADCRPLPGWARAMTAALAGHDVALGLSPVETGKGLAAKLAAYESWRTAILMCGAAAYGRPYMAVGRNWAYRRELYRRAGGLAPLFGALGGDDDLLLQQFTRHKARVAVCVAPDSLCPTSPPADMKRYLHQRVRHLGAGRSYRPIVLAALALHWISTVSCLVLPFNETDAHVASWMWMLLLFKFGFDFIMRRTIAVVAEEPRIRTIFNVDTVYEFISLVLTAVASLRALLPRKAW